MERDIVKKKKDYWDDTDISAVDTSIVANVGLEGLDESHSRKNQKY